MPKMKSTGPDKNTTALVAVLVAIGLAGLGYFAWQKIHRPAAPALVQETAPAPQPPTVAASQTEPPMPAEAATPPPAPEAKTPCQAAAAKLEAFFGRLDQRGYLATYGIKEKSGAHFAKVAKKLFAHPPVVVRENDDLFTILTNSAHFYRVLGKDDLSLIKDILNHEAGDIETAMADFYHWSELDPQCQDQVVTLRLPLAGLYDYAGFFLNTLGGQSYLFRRDSRVRMLVKYYAVLIIDRANDQGLNRYGIDIRDPLRSTIEEMQVSENLSGREAYLGTLLALQAKYRTKYGAKK